MPTSAFELVRQSELPDLRSQGRLFRHRATGMEVFQVLNEDRENLFAFAFRTPPRDSTGAAHILEHCVLCGSRRYPLKDAFIAFSKNSLNTFMNAMTFGDRTVYPAASIVGKDYYNLLDAYADAVFFPLLKEEAFLQEGHRLVPLGDGSAEIQGIVYSEMQGSYGSPESILDDRAFRALFDVGHPYSYDSGGDPEHIPELSYQSFLNFHRLHYHPSNCRLFLYGNIPAEEQLDFLEERYLSAFGTGQAVPPLPLQAPFASPRTEEVACPSAEGGGKASVLVSWLLCDTIDPAATIKAEMLSEILLGHAGSPLGRALRESGLGEDLAPQCGIGTETRQVCFQAGLRGIERRSAGAVEALILETLHGLHSGGLRAETVEAAVRGVEFSYREIRRGSGPYALRIMRRCLRGWIHGADPEATLRTNAAIRSVKDQSAAEPRFFEETIGSLLLDNPHRARVLAYPDPELAERRRAEQAQACAKRLAALGPDGLEALDASLKRLRRFQEEPDSARALAALPKVVVADLPRDIEVIPSRECRAGRVPVISQGLFTNGISYLDLAVDLSGLQPSLLPWLPLFTRFIVGAGLPGLPYHRMAERLALASGGLSCILQTGSRACAADTMDPGIYAIFRLKALDASLPESLELLGDLLQGADISDEERLQTLFAELRNDLVAAILPSGVSFAMARGAACFSVAAAVEEHWRGVTQYDFLKSLGDRPETSAIGQAMAAIRSAMAGGAAALASLTCDPGAEPAGLSALEAFCARLGFSAPGEGHGTVRPAILPAPRPPSPEAYIMPSEVGFATSVLKSPRLGHAAYPAYAALAQVLSAGPLWESIRMRRGAYGAWADADPLEGVFGMASYRDPGPVESWEDFRSALEWAAGPAMDKAEADKGILSTVSADLRPLTPEEKGLVCLRRRLFGVSDELRLQKRQGLLGLDAAALRGAAAALLDAWPDRVQTIFADEIAAKAAAARLPGIAVRRLEL